MLHVVSGCYFYVQGFLAKPLMYIEFFGSGFSILSEHGFKISKNICFVKWFNQQEFCLTLRIAPFFGQLPYLSNFTHLQTNLYTL